MADPKKILFIKPSSLGDIVHAMPVLAALRRRFPRAFIAWLVKRQWAELVERMEGVDRVWSVGSGVAGWLSEVPSLRAERFDLAVDLQGLFRSAVMARLAGCPERIGFANGREGSPFFYTRRVAVPTPDMHAVDRYLLVAQALGVAPAATPEFRFAIPARDREQVVSALAQAGVKAGARWIAMNVSARWPTKRWPAASFAEAADRLQKDGVGPVVLFGGPEDRADVQAVKSLMKSAPSDVTGLTPLGLLPAKLDAVGRPEHEELVALRAADLLAEHVLPRLEHVPAGAGNPVDGRLRGPQVVFVRLRRRLRLGVAHSIGEHGLNSLLAREGERARGHTRDARAHQRWTRRSARRHRDPRPARGRQLHRRPVQGLRGVVRQPGEQGRPRDRHGYRHWGQRVAQIGRAHV